MGLERTFTAKSLTCCHSVLAATVILRSLTATKHCMPSSIAGSPCAEVSAKEIIALNHGMDPKNIEEKQTILIPAGKLSSRDKEILAGPTLYASFTHDFACLASYPSWGYCCKHMWTGLPLVN